MEVNRVLVWVQLELGMDGPTKTDEFLEKFQTAFDPPLPTVSPGGNKPMCVFYQTCVEKTKLHMFGYFHTYVQ